MNKVTFFFGIDISKDSFDVYNDDFGHQQFSNNLNGFKRFFTQLDCNSHCVMEATGSYHYQLSLFLYEQGLRVSVVNPLVIKRFIQMKLRRLKTDKSDSLMIYRYACEQELSLWSPDPKYVLEGKELLSLVQLYLKQSTSLKNKLHALEKRGVKKGVILLSLKRQLRVLKKEINLLETRLEVLIKTQEPQLFSRLTSIPGVGKKTAVIFMVVTSNFESFESHKQLSSFLGLAPNERSSGSSIRGRSRISKASDGLLRNHLFMCSFTACTYNPQCKALYDRIVAKGKSKKLALIAVCNKLIKQAYGIAKSGLPYDPEYVGK